MQENPDVGGNQKLIKAYKNELVVSMEELMHEMEENQQYHSFKESIDKGLDKQEEFDRLRNLEKELNADIKKINEDLKKKQDDFAKEA